MPKDYERLRVIKLGDMWFEVELSPAGSIINVRKLEYYQENEIKKDEQYITDSNGKKKELPLAIVRATRGLKDKSTNGNEEEKERNFYKLSIEQQLEQTFNFDVYLDEKNTIVTSDRASKKISIGSSSGFDESYYRNNVNMWFKGSSDFDQNKFFTVPSDWYKAIKTALEYVGIVVIEDETEDDEMEEEKKIEYTFNENPKKKDIEEMISQVDLKTFTKLIKARLAYQGTISEIEKITEAWAKKYLATWAKNKYKFFKMFGNKLTLEFKEEIKKDSYEFELRRKELTAQFPLYAPILNKINGKAFEENTIKTKSANYINANFFEDTKVKNNLSLTKFISLFGNKELDTELSKIYQDKGKAHLYISINPIDYLTVSINKSGWESCHHFFNGCYRNAGLAYMNDETSLVAFRSEKEMETTLGGKKINWNTKNWRQMIYVSTKNSAIVFSRQYPYESEELSQHIRSNFEECFSNFFGGSNKWIIYHREEDAKVEVLKHNYDLLYNDVAHSFKHKVVRAKDDVSTKKTDTDWTAITIGEDIKGVISDKTIYSGDQSIW